MAEVDDIAADLEELEEFLVRAKRPRVKGLLQHEIEALKTVRSQQQAAHQNGTSEESKQKVESGVESSGSPSLPQSSATPVHKSSQSQSIHYITLDRFSYDQESDKLKVYIFLEGATEDKVAADFKENSFELRIHDVGGKNYRCGVPKLNKAIDAKNCKVLVKPKRITVVLRKLEKGSWSDIRFKEDKLKPTKENDKDPMAGIMDLMKNMYEEGDEETKRTIAKAWTESRSGKKSDPKSRFDEDFDV